MIRDAEDGRGCGAMMAGRHKLLTLTMLPLLRGRPQDGVRLLGSSGNTLLHRFLCPEVAEELEVLHHAHFRHYLPRLSGRITF